MHWIDQFQLFLFDLDGLLVNTEAIHYRAYMLMCKNRGYTLNWDFPTYFSIASRDSDGIKNSIYKEFPSLYEKEPNWSHLHAEKNNYFISILEEESAPLLEGVKEFLNLLEKAGKKRCVVTHSTKKLTTLLRSQNPTLNSIPNWLTREDYEKAKPAPDGYLKAVNLHSLPGEKVIGFEDSMRGMQSLLGTNATPILINPYDSRTREDCAMKGIVTFNSMKEIVHPSAISG